MNYSYLNILENKPCELSEKYLHLAKEMLLNSPNLPFKIQDNYLITDNYIIGQIQLDDLIIQISPRNSALSLQSYFEMLMYINFKFDTTFNISNISMNNTFGISAISELFLNLCTNLLRVGITGDYVVKKENSLYVKGNIDFNKFNRHLMPFDGIYSQYNFYEINILPNQIIKTALNKIVQLENNSELKKKLLLISKEFEYIDENKQDIRIARSSVKSFFSSNPYYSITLEYAFKILENMHFSLDNGNIKWSSFLENSNDIFEKYIREILSHELNHHIEKWRTPKNFAILVKGEFCGYKSYSPDILIDYDEKVESCSVVLDVKNKSFNLTTSNISDLVSSQDLYQLFFYCSQLNCNLGGLIYPCKNSSEPISINLYNQSDMKLFLIGINMTLDIRNRHLDLITNLKKFLLINL